MSWLGSFSASTSAGLAVTAVAGGVGWVKARPLWREHVRRQERISDQLDPSTPGGITDVIEAIKERGSDADSSEAKPGRDRR